MTQKKECFVGLDTSNYTTSAAFCDADGRVVANLKMPLTVKAGERGLRQSDAVFAHVKNLPTLMDLLREKLEGISDKWVLKTVWGVGYKFELLN